MTNAEDVPENARWAGYKGSPRKNLHREWKQFATGDNGFFAWWDSFKQAGYTEVLGWLVYSVGMPVGLEAHVLAEKPACT